MFWNKKDSLKKVYYRSFSFLIVIPILTVFLVSLNVIRVMMRNSAISEIQSSQETIVSTLSKNINESSLQLSHFVYASNSKFIELAANTDTSDLRERYDYIKSLNEAFHITMVPKQNILASMIYMKDGTTTYWKDEVTIPSNVIKETEWYRQALEHKNKIMLGSYDTAIERTVYSQIRSNEVVLVVALSPNQEVDKLGKIEMITLFVKADIGKYVRKNNQNKLLGQTIILDNMGTPVLGQWNDRIEKSMTEMSQPFGEGVHKKDGYTFVVSKVPESGWGVVNYIETPKLTYAYNQVMFLMVTVIIVLFILFYLFSRYFLRNIVTPVHTMVEGLEQIETGRLDIAIAADGQSEIRTMIHSFNSMVQRLKYTIKENEKAQQKKHEAEVRALQSQINPHFLVNTLNSIRFMAQVSKFDGIRKMAEALIRILSCSFRQNGSFYCVKEELEVLDSYIYLMKIRYSEGFDVTYSVAEECLEQQMPRLILQPIVENSIVHGFMDMGEDMGHLHINIWREDSKLYLEVVDNGKGMDAKAIQNVQSPKSREENDNYNIGIDNTFSRLKLYFGEECDLSMESEPGKYTRTRISMPITEVKQPEVDRDEESIDC